MAAQETTDQRRAGRRATRPAATGARWAMGLVLALAAALAARPGLAASASEQIADAKTALSQKKYGEALELLAALPQQQRDDPLIAALTEGARRGSIRLHYDKSLDAYLKLDIDLAKTELELCRKHAESSHPLIQALVVPLEARVGKFSGSIDQQIADARKLLEEGLCCDAVDKLSRCLGAAKVRPDLADLHAAAVQTCFNTHMAAGQDALEEGSYSEAARHFQIALRRDRKDPGALDGCLKSRRLADAAKQCQDAARLLEQGKTKEAFELCSQAARAAADCPEVAATLDKCQRAYADTLHQRALELHKQGAKFLDEEALAALLEAKKLAAGHAATAKDTATLRAALADVYAREAEHFLAEPALRRSGIAWHAAARAAQLVPENKHHALLAQRAKRLFELKNSIHVCIHSPGDEPGDFYARDLVRQLTKSGVPTLQASLGPGDELHRKLDGVVAFARLAQIDKEAPVIYRAFRVALRIDQDIAKKQVDAKPTPARALAGEAQEHNPKRPKLIQALRDAETKAKGIFDRYDKLLAAADLARTALARAKAKADADKARAATLAEVQKLLEELSQTCTDGGLGNGAAEAARALHAIQTTLLQATEEKARALQQLDTRERENRKATDQRQLALKDIRANEQIMLALRTQIDVEPEKTTKPTFKDYNLEQGRVVVNVEARIHVTLARLQGDEPIIEKTLARKKTWTRPFAKGVHPLDAKTQVDQPDRTLPEKALLGDARQDIAAALYALTLAHLRQCHRPVLDRARRAAKARNVLDAIEAYAEFLHLEGGRGPAARKEAEAYVKAHITERLVEFR